MSMKILAVLAICMGLAACGTPTSQVIESKVYVQATVPDKLLKCDLIARLPNPNTLTDAEVATLIARLYHDNAECHYNMEAIKKYEHSAKQIVKKKK